MIVIFSEHITPRLIYVLDFCFSQKGLEYKIVQSTTEWNQYKSCRINYSYAHVPAEIQMKPHDVLFEENIREEIKLTQRDHQFELDGIPDQFAVIFFNLTRYEEYWPHERDEHNRYPSSQSDLVKLGVQNRPVNDEIVKSIWAKLELDYHAVEKNFECVPSFDIDVAWAYKNRPFLRTLGSAVKHGKLGERLKVMTGKKQDPYDTYSYIAELAARVNRIICFAPVGDYAKYDKNIHWKNPHYQSLIRGLNASGGMGLHPSYDAFENKNKLDEELDRLQQIVGHEIVKVRMHFLRLRIPDTYEMMIDMGIQRDFTMGYADNTGFRAGTSFPFYFFNLRTNKQYNLLLFPFAYMDGVLKDRLKLNVQQAINQVKELMDSVKNCGGVFMCIWHNSTIHNQDEWKDWREVLEYTLSRVEKRDISDLDDDFFV